MKKHKQDKLSFTEPPEARPVFLVGWRRTGTTWLGSLLSNHPGIAAVVGGQPGQTGGVVENGFFHYLAERYGSLKSPNQLIQLLLIWTNSTFFRLSKIEPQQLFTAKPKSYAQVFKLTMDLIAKKQEATHWLDKCPAHSLYPQRLLQDFPKAKFVAIKRDIQDQVTSALKLTEKIRSRQLRPGAKALLICKEVLAYHLAYAAIAAFTSRHPDKIYNLDYQDLVKDRVRCLKELCNFLDLEFVPQMESSPFKPGSSFLDQGAERTAVLSSFHKRLISLLDTLFKALPATCFLPLIWIRKKIFPPKLPFWFFSCIIEEYQWEDIFGSGRSKDL